MNKYDIEEKVKCRSKKKYTCKRNRGEHEFLEPVIKYKQSIRYIHKLERGTLYTDKLQDEPLIRTEINIALETHCKHCGHKQLVFLSERIK